MPPLLASHPLCGGDFRRGRRDHLGTDCRLTEARTCARMPSGDLRASRGLELSFAEVFTDVGAPGFRSSWT